ncbi:Glucanosyltransferase-domain-containing protein [Truncatella angustata]|uniref:1,3-beta-glucanosyltransferase n=1 Tax=Truncatella angustata TaxID=152316 RepID=A0A9P8UNA0_9PEZI|nr:Glucanosyltransferase-domain-containing protein [Truncatella angustata]KAH6655190.1 Glucanosyltransferase-domain-containing protein [Truncatella angustata]
MGLLKTVLASSMLLASNVAALDAVVMKGTKFFYENGTQFYIKGVAYQQDTAAGGETSSETTTYSDPLADEDACKRDVPLLEALGTNTIRTYAIDPTKDHSACMKLLSAAGIYVISDLSEPSLSINRDSPAWNVDLYDRYKNVVNELAQYDNVIGFFAGNEVSNNASNTEASAYVKAAVRDTKNHIASLQAAGGRWLGVGYAANDDANIRHNLADYFNCGNQSEAIDFFGYNIYSWCGSSSFTESGYNTQVDFFSNYSVPVFFAEYGCNTVNGAEGREWDDTTALYSDEMTGVFSGGIVYMYFEEDNDYGLVKLDGDDASTMSNYEVLSSKIAKATPSSVSMSAYEATNTAQACPAVGDSWQAAEALPPTPNRDLCECMYKSLTCQPASSLDSEDYGDIFNYICGNDADACASIKHDESTGVYGPYVGCNSTQQLGAVLQAYYENQNSASTSCDFDGSATINSKPASNGTCDTLMEAASSSASTVATATGGSSSSTSTANFAAGPIRMDTLMTVGDYAIGIYLVAAGAVGAAMVAL